MKFLFSRFSRNKNEVHFEKIKPITILEGQVKLLPSRCKISTQAGPLIEVIQFTSAGLANFGQREIIVSFAAENGMISDQVIPLVSKYFGAITPFAAEGKLVGSGDFTGFGSQLGGFSGVIYLDGEIFEFLTDASDKLVGVFVLANEIRAAMQFGGTRVASVLGKVNRFYPTPIWDQLERNEELFEQISNTSMLSQVSGLSLASSHIFYRGPAAPAEFILHAEDAAYLMDSIDRQLGLETPFFLRLQMAEEADGCLVWYPGQEGPQAITPPDSQGQNLSGVFLGVIPEQEENSLKMIEDGFFLSLTPEAYPVFLDAIRNRSNIEIELGGEIAGFNLTHRN